jgi:uncharacterized protein (DUF488 family)
MELYTIGYEGLSQTGLVGILNQYEISIVADVRRVPSSRKKGFSKRGLEAFLSNHNIGYVSFRDLGTPQEMRAKLKASRDYEGFFNEFREMLAERGEYLSNILALVQHGEKVGLLCFEQDAYKCHRRIVAEEVRRMDGNGLTIRHLRCHF